MRSAPPIAPGMPRREREPRDAGLLRGLRDAQIRHRGAGAHAIVRLDLDLVEAAPEPDHHAATPPSRTIRFEPSPMTVTGISAGRFASR